MLYSYPAAFYRDEDGWTVIFPDLDYAATCGKTYDDTLAMAVDLLAGWLYNCTMFGEELPAPSKPADFTAESVARHQDLETSPEQFVSLVSVDVQEYARTHFEKAVKKTLTIPRWLNEAAKEREVNFSQVLQRALIEEIKNDKTQAASR